jgi:hypothetical protein
MRLGWPDLLIELPPEEVGPLLEPWAWKVEGRVAPIFLNKFGAWFLLRPAGHVDMLDVCSGELSVAAESYEGPWSTSRIGRSSTCCPASCSTFTKPAKSPPKESATQSPRILHSAARILLGATESIPLRSWSWGCVCGTRSAGKRWEGLRRSGTRRPAPRSGSGNWYARSAEFLHGPG